LLKGGSFYRKNLISAIDNLSDNIQKCENCNRFYQKGNLSSKVCNICTSKERDKKTILIVEKDADLDVIENVGSYNGIYFVLGEFVRLTKDDYSTRLKNELKKYIDNIKPIEIILALPATVEGDHSSDILSDFLHKNVNEDTKITILGRGLSTGVELEYADIGTIKSALSSRIEK
jgi:recombination protein RecR